MQAFNPIAVCPKCTNADVSMQHQTAGAAWSFTYVGKIPEDDLEFAKTHEHMVRTCSRCSFQWFERCAELGDVRKAADTATDHLELARRELAFVFTEKIGGETTAAERVALAALRSAAHSLIAIAERRGLPLLRLKFPGGDIGSYARPASEGADGG